jgi:glutamyl/glutaminyl-tRNA synthetase
MRILPLILDRISTLGEVSTLSGGGELTYFFKDPVYDANNLLWKDEPDSLRASLHLGVIAKLLDEISPGQYNAETIKAVLWEYATQEGRGNVLWPLRYALSGREKSPDPFTLASIIGKESSLRRIAYAKNILEHALTAKL